MATNGNANAITSKCSVCDQKFNSTQECLKHELFEHSSSKKNSQNRVKKRLNTTLKNLNADEKLSERVQLKERLKKCKNGEELHTIFEMFCMKTDSLNLIFTRIQTCLEKELRSAGIVRIYPFGSIASGLALRDCDIDIFLDISLMEISAKRKRYSQKEDHDTQQRLAFNRINNLLHRSSHFTEVFAIRGARVPIIKCKHKDTGFSIDINISYPSSRENTQFIYDLVKSDERIHELMLFLKLWAKNTQVIGRSTMNSYCLITLIIFFLQQPLKSAKETNSNGDCRILKSIKELQTNCQFHMVQGINYAYNLSHKENTPKLPTTVSTWDLIREFFNFYKDYNFEDSIISPYYGKTLKKTDLTPDICEEYYKQLRTITQFMQGKQANNLQMDFCMCVQDAFCLNQNTAKNIQPHSKQYFLLCLHNAHKICENPNKDKLAELYERLLFETIKITDSINEIIDKAKPNVVMDLKKLVLPTTADTQIDNSKGNLTYTLIPSKADMRTLVSRYPDVVGVEPILRCWCQYYVKAIATILTKLFRMDMQIHTPAKQKQIKLDNEDADKKINQSWLISCTIDLWTNRCFQKCSQTSFMSYQLDQTERLYNLRRQDPKFSVNLNGILKINTRPNNMGIDIQLDLSEGSTATCLNKKSPLRKFFNVFKNTLQNCNFKETLNINDANAKNETESIKQLPKSTITTVAVIKNANADNL